MGIARVANKSWLRACPSGSTTVQCTSREQYILEYHLSTLRAPCTLQKIFYGNECDFAFWESFYVCHPDIMCEQLCR